MSFTAPKMTYIRDEPVDYFKDLKDIGSAFLGDDEIKQKELEAKARREAQPETWAAEYNLDPNATISNSYERLQQAKDQVRMKFKDLPLEGGKDYEAEEESSKVETAVTQGIFALLGPALGYMLGGNKMAAAGAQIGARGAAQMGEIAKRKEATAATERLAKEAEYTGRMGAIANQEKVLSQQAFKRQDREAAQDDRFDLEEFRQRRADARAAKRGSGTGGGSGLSEEDIEKLVVGAGELSPEQEAAYRIQLRAGGLLRGRDYLDTIRKGGTLDLAKDKFSYQQEAANLGSWETYKPVSKKQQDQALEIATGMQGIRSALNALKTAVGNRVDFTGEEGTQRAQAYSQAEFALQKFFALGANFTESEQAKVNNMLPLVGDLQSFLKGELTARKAKFAAENLLRNLEDSATNTMFEIGYRKRAPSTGSVGAGALSTDEKRRALLAEMNKAKAGR